VLVKRAAFLTGLLALGQLARAEDSNTDIARLTMGSPVFPSGSWVFEATPILSMNAWSNPSQDTLEPIVSVAHAFTDTFTLALNYEGQDAARDAFKPSEVNIEGRYLVLDAPLLLAPYALVGVPFPGQSLSVLAGLEAVKNLGPVTLRGLAEGEGYGEHQGVAFRGNFSAGAYYRFGLNGIVGGALEYQTDGGLAIEPLVGGRVSPNLFLAMQPSIGLTRGAPDFRLFLQLTFYWGPFRASGLE
jgi:hypothetical protein